MNIRLETADGEFVGHTSLLTIHEDGSAPYLVSWGSRLFRLTKDTTSTYTEIRTVYRECYPLEVMPIVSEEDTPSGGALKLEVDRIMVVVNQLRSEITDLRDELREELVVKKPQGHGVPLCTPPRVEHDLYTYWEGREAAILCRYCSYTPLPENCEHQSRGPMASTPDTKREWCRICSVVIENGVAIDEKVPPPVQLPEVKNTAKCSHKGTVASHYAEGERKYWCWSCCTPVNIHPCQTHVCRNEDQDCGQCSVQEAKEAFEKKESSGEESEPCPRVDADCGPKPPCQHTHGFGALASYPDRARKYCFSCKVVMENGVPTDDYVTHPDA